MGTHWKKLTNPDYLGTYSLEDGRDMVVQIDYVKQELVVGADGKKEECIVAHLVGQKPMILNHTNCKTITKIYGTPIIEEWAGKYITLYSAQVKAFGEVVDALRIRPKKPTFQTFTCADCKGAIQGAGGKSAADIAAMAKAQYGRCLCVPCARKELKRLEEEKEARSAEQDRAAGQADTGSGAEVHTE